LVACHGRLKGEDLLALMPRLQGTVDQPPPAIPSKRYVDIRPSSRVARAKWMLQGDQLLALVNARPRIPELARTLGKG